MLQDIRFGLRMLARNPGVTALAVIALALGIGANTAIFSVVNAVLLRPMPFPEPERLVWLWPSNPSRNLAYAFSLYANFGEWRDASQSFESMTAYFPVSANLLVGDEPERIDILRVSASFLHMAGVRPMLGRDFVAEDDQPGAPKVALLDYGLWQRRFAADANITGRQILLDGVPYSIAGVLPADFTFANLQRDLYVPFARSTARSPGAGMGLATGVWARLKPGVSVERAQADMDAVVQRVQPDFQKQGWSVRVWRVRDYLVRDVRLSLMVLLGAVGLVLLIACANVANLLLARASVRQREIALRTALGAGRWRILRQLLTESALLGLAGGIAGLGLAYASIKLLPRFDPKGIPFLKQAALDAPVLGFAMLISLVTGLVFGLAPAISAFRARVYETLKEGSASSGESRGRSRFRSALVVIEVAMALLLTIGASLMMRTLLRIQQAGGGFDAEGVLTASIALPATKYPQPEQRIAFFRQLLDRLAAMPGAQVASMTSLIPLGGSNTAVNLYVEGQPPTRPSDVPFFYQRVIDPAYFRAMRIPVLKGREFTEQDTGSPRVVIVNQTLARRYFPGGDAVGRRLGNGNMWMTVVGVVGDVKHMSLTKDPDPEVYEPYRQGPRPDMVLVLRSGSDPIRLAPALRRAVLDLDRDQPVSRVMSMSQRVSDALGAPRFAALLLAAFGMVALLLAAVGIYGVISFSVARRTREIGVRMALGAAGGDVLQMVVRQAVLLAVFGVVVGVAGVLALTRVIRSMLYGASATDPTVFAAVALLLIAIAALAAYIPARRAARVSPSVALRYE